MPTIVAFALVGLFAIIAIPLALRMIGPNAWYGFRTPETLADPELWYSANAFAGRAMLVAAIVSAVLLWLRPAWFAFGVFTNLAAVVLPSVGALIASFVYLRNHR